MSRSPDLATLTDRSPQGIAGAFGRAIRAGELAPGDRLPTVREVAAELGVSARPPSVAAWQALRRTGLVVSRGRAGTFVRETPRAVAEPAPARTGRRQSRRPADGPLARHPRPDAAARASAPPSAGSRPAPAPAPTRTSRCCPQLRRGARRDLALPDRGDHRRRRRHRRHRPGARAGVHLGDRVALESPGFPPFYDLVESLGAEIVPLEIDDSGVRPESLRAALDARPVAVVLQPRAQNPTGISMSPERAPQARCGADEATSPAGAVDRRGRPLRRHQHQPRRLARHLPPGSGRARAQLLQVARPRPADRRAGRPRRDGRPRSSRDGCSGRAGPRAWCRRSCYDLLTQARSMDEVSEARRQYFGTPARPGRAARRPGDRRQHARRHQPVAAGARRARRPAPPGRRGHPRRRQAPPFFPGDASPPHIRVTSGLVDPEHAAEVAAALMAAAAAA